MSVPTISVIIPAYKAAGTIGRAVRSVLSQERPADEILVVDDGSPDDITPALAEFGDAVSLVRKTNGGAASARNLGVDTARGDWVAFLDADDHWEPGKLRRQCDIIERYPAVGLVAGRWYDQPADGSRRVTRTKYDGFFGRLLTPSGADAFRVALCVWTTTVLARREAVARRRFVSGLEPAEDRDLWVRLAADTPVYLIDEPVATYVDTPGSMCRTNVDRDCGNMMSVVRRCADLLGPRLMREEETILYRKWAAGHLAVGDAAAALRPAARRLGREPASAEAWWVLAKAAALACVGRSKRVAGRA